MKTPTAVVYDIPGTAEVEVRIFGAIEGPDTALHLTPVQALRLAADLIMSAERRIRGPSTDHLSPDIWGGGL